MSGNHMPRRHVGTAVIACIALCSASVASAQAVFFDGFEAPLEACQDPLIGPPGWDVQSTTWVNAFSSPDGSPQATYPNSVGFPVPIGADKNKLRVISFVPFADLTVTMTWDNAQSNPAQGYTARPADSMFIAISPCPADVRVRDALSADPWLRNGCRQIAGGSSMFYSTVPGDPNNDIVCRLQAGEQYFITVAPIDPGDGLDLGEHTCNDSINTTQFGCDVQMIHSGN